MVINPYVWPVHTDGRWVTLSARTFVEEMSVFEPVPGVSVFCVGLYSPKKGITPAQLDVKVLSPMLNNKHVPQTISMETASFAFIQIHGEIVAKHDDSPTISFSKYVHGEGVVTFTAELEYGPALTNNPKRLTPLQTKRFITGTGSLLDNDMVKLENYEIISIGDNLGKVTPHKPNFRPGGVYGTSPVTPLQRNPPSSPEPQAFKTAKKKEKTKERAKRHKYNSNTEDEKPKAKQTTASKLKEKKGKKEEHIDVDLEHEHPADCLIFDIAFPPFECFVLSLFLFLKLHH